MDDHAAMRVALDEALPPGLDVVEVVEAGPGTLADRLTAGVWEVVLPGTDPHTVAEAIEQFTAREVVEVERITQKGRRRLDARAAVVRMGLVDDVDVRSDLGRAAVGGGAVCAILQLVVRHATPAVRPDDVLTALHAVAGLAPASPPQVTRMAQGLLDEKSGTVADPLAPDRDAAGAAERRAPGDWQREH